MNYKTLYVRLDTGTAGAGVWTYPGHLVGSAAPLYLVVPHVQHRSVPFIALRLIPTKTLPQYPKLGIWRTR